MNNFDQQTQTLGIRLHENVAQAMQRQGINREELAARMNWHPTRVNRLLLEPANTSMETLARLAGALGVDPAALLAEPPPVWTAPANREPHPHAPALLEPFNPSYPQPAQEPEATIDDLPF